MWFKVLKGFFLFLALVGLKALFEPDRTITAQDGSDGLTASGCKTSIAQPTFKRSPNHPGHDVRVWMRSP